MEQSKMRVILFWILFIVGILTHSQGDVLPIFWGVDVAMEHTAAAPTGLLAFMMIITYVVPLCGILLVFYGKRRSSAIANLILASVIALFNLVHCSELFTEFSYTKLFTLPFLLIVSIILVIESRRYLRSLKA